MPRTVRVRALLVVGVLGALALTGCARPAPEFSDIGCPAGFSGAVAQRAVVGGTPTARVQVVPPSWLAVPVSWPLRNACVLRVTYPFRPSVGAAYLAMTPGDAAAGRTIAAAMLRSGWAATNGSGRLIGPGGRTAQVTLYSSSRFLAGLPTGFRMPASSSYAHRPVTVLTIADPHGR